MFNKRPASGSNSDGQMNEGSDHEIQQGTDTKRAKRTLSTDTTTVEDLPIEMVECILVKAVAIEVKSMKLVSVVWKEKADHVIDRLKTVCSQWNNILTTSFFRNEVHMILDKTGQEKIHLKMLNRLTVQFFVFEVTATKGEIFMLSRPNGNVYGEDYVIKVCERSNMAQVTDVISLPGSCLGMAACNVPNCLYVLNYESHCSSLLRIAKAEGQSYKASTWITGLQVLPVNITVSSDDSPLIISKCGQLHSPVVSIYDASGSLQHTVSVSSLMIGDRWLEKAIQKANGNLVLVATGSQCRTLLMEFDLKENVVRQFQTRLVYEAAFPDIYGRIWMTDFRHSIEVVDSELNLLDSAGSQLNDTEHPYSQKLLCNCERNEMVRTSYTDSNVNTILTVFLFK